jgi:uncharacterized membrane protein
MVHLLTLVQDVGRVYSRAVESGDDTDISPQQARNADPGRLATLTDGVFAIVMTILVLDLEIPDTSDGESVADSIRELGPTFSAFVISFLLVSMYWVWHRGVFAQVRYVDYRLVWLNLLFLLPVSMIPFAASTLGSHPNDASALQLYGMVLVAVTLMRSLLNWYLHRHAWMLWQPPSNTTRRLSTIAAAAPLVAYSVAILIAASAPVLSTLLYLSVPMIYAAVVLFLKSDARTATAAQDIS